MAEDYEPKDFGKESKYNAGLLQIQRISRLWDNAHIAAQSKDWGRYEVVLERVWMELAPDAEPESFKAIEKLIISLSKVKAIKSGWKSEMLKEENPDLWKKEQEKGRKMQRALEEYEIFLRKVQNKQGKGTAYLDESDEAAD